MGVSQSRGNNDDDQQPNDDVDENAKNGVGRKWNRLKKKKKKNPKNPRRSSSIVSENRKSPPPMSSNISENRRCGLPKLCIPKRRSSTTAAVQKIAEKSESPIMTSTEIIIDNNNMIDDDHDQNSSGPSPIVAAFMTNISSSYRRPNNIDNNNNRYRRNISTTNSRNSKKPWTTRRIENDKEDENENDEYGSSKSLLFSKTFPPFRSLSETTNNNLTTDDDDRNFWTISKTTNKNLTSPMMISRWEKKRRAIERMAAVLDIPSPVPSQSEPDSSESESEDHHENDQILELEDKKKELLEEEEDTEVLKIENENGVIVESRTTTSDFIISGCCANPLGGGDNCLVKEKGGSVDNGDIYVITAGCIDQEKEAKKNQVSGNNGIFEEEVEKAKSIRKKDRPTQLLVDQLLQVGGNSNLADGRMAPLAESECFVIENSPAVEELPDQQLIDNIIDDIVDTTDRSAGGGSRSLLLSRLKNPSAYSDRQRAIYDTPKNYYFTTKKDDVQEDNNTSKEELSEKTDISSTNSSSSSNNCGRHQRKLELHDSGIKMDSLVLLEEQEEEEENGNSGGGGLSSPDVLSIDRGLLIDDEIRDQPDLLTIESSANCNSGASPERSQISISSKDDSSRRAAVAAGSGRYSTTASSLSIDSNDAMLDYFDDQQSLFAEEQADSFSASSPFRSAKPSGSGSGSWSLGRRRGTKNATVHKRSSLEAVMDEWEALKKCAISGQHSALPSNTSRGEDYDYDSTTSCMNSPISGGSLTGGSVDQQTYRHMVQDVTVVKTMLLRLKRVLQQEQEESNSSSSPFKNKCQHDPNVDITSGDADDSDTLKEENKALKVHLTFLSRQLEDQKRIIECLQQQLKHCHRSGPLRRSESLFDESSNHHHRNKNIHQHQVLAEPALW